MKNILIALLLTYIFWSDVCVVHPLPVLPLIFGLFWAVIAGVEDLFIDYFKTVKRGKKLAGRVKRLKHE